jgi:hypothetical protein
LRASSSGRTLIILFTQYVATINEPESRPTPVFAGPPLPPPSSPISIPVLKVDSELFDDKGSLSISKMLDARDRHQSDTKTRSERVLELDPKFDQVKATRIALAAEQNPDVFALTALSVKEESV